MDAALAFLTTTVGLLAAGFLIVFLLGWYFLWRSRRKLRETT